jgi:protein-tyrosine phosphatase
VPKSPSLLLLILGHPPLVKPLVKTATSPNFRRSFCFPLGTSRQSLHSPNAMDRIPKFRRKPKNPTIETSIERSSSDTADSIASSELQAANLQSQHQGQQVQPQKTKLSKRAAFKNFRFRGSIKRARDISPAELPSSPPPPAVVSHDGIRSRPVTAENDALGSYDGVTPRIPAFLESSLQSIPPKKRQAH